MACLPFGGHKLAVCDQTEAPFKLALLFLFEITDSVTWNMSLEWRENLEQTMKLQEENILNLLGFLTTTSLSGIQTAVLSNLAPDNRQL